jgi:hypothetical protein
MRESRSYGSVGEPVGDHRLYPEEPGGATLPATRLDRFISQLFNDIPVDFPRFRVLSNRGL